MLAKNSPKIDLGTWINRCWTASNSLNQGFECRQLECHAYKSGIKGIIYIYTHKKGCVVLSTRQTVPQDPTEQPRKLVRPVTEAGKRNGGASKEGNIFVGGCAATTATTPNSDPPTLRGRHSTVLNRGDHQRAANDQLSCIPFSTGSTRDRAGGRQP